MSSDSDSSHSTNLCESPDVAVWWTGTKNISKKDLIDSKQMRESEKPPCRNSVVFREFCPEIDDKGQAYFTLYPYGQISRTIFGKVRDEERFIDTSFVGKGYKPMKMLAIDTDDDKYLVIGCVFTKKRMGKVVLYNASKDTWMLLAEGRHVSLVNSDDDGVVTFISHERNVETVHRVLIQDHCMEFKSTDRGENMRSMVVGNNWKAGVGQKTAAFDFYAKTATELVFKYKDEIKRVPIDPESSFQDMVFAKNMIVVLLHKGPWIVLAFYSLSGEKIAEKKHRADRVFWDSYYLEIAKYISGSYSNLTFTENTLLWTSVGRESIRFVPEILPWHKVSLKEYE